MENDEKYIDDIDNVKLDFFDNNILLNLFKLKSTDYDTYNNYVNKDFITNLFNIRIFTLLERDICIICHNKKSVVKLFGHCTKTL